MHKAQLPKFPIAAANPLMWNFHVSLGENEASSLVGAGCPRRKFGGVGHRVRCAPPRRPRARNSPGLPRAGLAASHVPHSDLRPGLPFVFGEGAQSTAWAHRVDKVLVRTRARSDQPQSRPSSRSGRRTSRWAAGGRLLLLVTLAPAWAVEQRTALCLRIAELRHPCSLPSTLTTLPCHPRTGRPPLMSIGRRWWCSSSLP